MFESTFQTFYDVKDEVDSLTYAVSEAAKSVGLDSLLKTPGPTASSFAPPAPTPSEQDTYTTDPNAGLLTRLAGALGLPAGTVKAGVGLLGLLGLLYLAKKVLFKRRK